MLARLAHLGAMVARLAQMRTLSAEQRTDPVIELAAERAVHVAIESILDIGHHVLAGRGHPVPGSYREVVPALVRYGVLDPALGTRLDGMAGMRNILVHDYVDVDVRYLWGVIDQKLDDLRQVHAAFAALPELGR